MRRLTHPRRGAGLFSLLVLLAILALLAALLLPAIQKVREAANRMRSANNLKQMALSIHMFHNDYNQFPKAGKGAPTAQKQLDNGSWCFHILPYMEQDNLYRSILGGQPGNVSVATNYCPGRRLPQAYNGRSKIDYAGCVGTADDPEKPDKENGMIVYKDRITFAHVLDGTSNTVMLGEKWINPADYLTGTGAGDNDSCWIGGKVDALRSSNGDQRPPHRDLVPGDHHRGFGSPFSGGCNFAFGDGSVRVVRYTIKPKVFQFLCDRADGNVIDTNDLD
jgi:prepilin-type processing-associated H-X9-DG protein